MSAGGAESTEAAAAAAAAAEARAAEVDAMMCERRAQVTSLVAARDTFEDAVRTARREASAALAQLDNPQARFKNFLPLWSRITY